MGLEMSKHREQLDHQARQSERQSQQKQSTKKGD
jgi:hypothetical protein